MMYFHYCYNGFRYFYDHLYHYIIFKTIAVINVIFITIVANIIFSFIKLLVQAVDW